LLEFNPFGAAAGDHVRELFQDPVLIMFDGRRGPSMRRVNAAMPRLFSRRALAVLTGTHVRTSDLVPAAWNVHATDAGGARQSGTKMGRMKVRTGAGAEATWINTT